MVSLLHDSAGWQERMVTQSPELALLQWLAQVADFGLAQAVRPGETIHTEAFGTITHMVSHGAAT